MEDPLYREIILEHWQNPQNYGKVSNPDFDTKDLNPTCGDTIRISGKVTKGIITEFKFVSQGCAISKAAASLFSQNIKGLAIVKISSIKKEDVLRTLPVKITPARNNCALLILKVLNKSFK